MTIFYTTFFHYNRLLSMELRCGSISFFLVDSRSFVVQSWPTFRFQFMSHINSRKVNCTSFLMKSSNSLIISLFIENLL